MKQVIISAVLLSTSLLASVLSNAKDPALRDNTGKVRSGNNTSIEISSEKNRKPVAVYSKDMAELIGYASFITADQLPGSVTGFLEKNYSGYRVAGKIVEVTYSDSSAYVFTIENEKEILTLRVEGRNSLVLNRLEKI